ncbi:MAG TPA: CoA-binding protein [Dehalococcoidia bacterium]|nr:CoA-binding protein [Dehalococcoidia bacterium]
MTISLEHLRRVLNPRTVVVVGSKKADGYMWLRNYSTFRDGPLYSVQIDPNEIPGIEAMGVRNFTSLMDVPGEIDYAMLAVPRPVAPRVLADCAKKGVAGVALFTSGFAETGEEDGIRLQEQVLEIARAGGIALIGPNCMGLYNRRLGIRQSAEQGAGEAGDAGFISQSGTHAINFGLVGEQYGVRVSTSISIGNAIVLDVPDYLDYLADDAETKVIAMYIEGVKDGARFVRSLRRAASLKPVVVWKGGVTDAGARATMSHTGSLAAPTAVFNAIVRQAGAVLATSLEDTIDVVKALLYAKPTTGRGMGLMAMTGGQSVVITDAFVQAGLEVPRLSDASYAELREFFNIIGGSYQNPLDMGGTVGYGQASGNMRKLFEILDGDPHVDAIAMEMASGFLARMWAANPASLDTLLDTLSEHQERSSKPFVAVLQPQHVEDVVRQARLKVQERGIAAFASFERAAGALRRAIDYHRFKAGVD